MPHEDNVSPNRASVSGYRPVVISGVSIGTKNWPEPAAVACTEPSGRETRDRAAPVARLVVEDNGPGVSPQDLQRLTRRFYRAERSRTAPGNGLGLSLVSAVAELHGATLTLEAGTWGFRATITFTL